MQTEADKHPFKAVERVKVEVLVINRVVMQLFENRVSTMKLDCTDSIRCQAVRHASNDVIGIGDVRNNIAREYNVCLSIPSDNPLRYVESKELSERWYTILLSHRGDIARRIDAEHSVAAFHELLEEGSVITRYLHYE
jgi:hypothetical protein